MTKLFNFALLIALFMVLTSESGCFNTSEPVSTSGVSKATIKVQTDLNGKTIEQNAIIRRLTEDNKPGSIKHLYIISSYSGQVIIYSTVRGKVTSSGKRLSPSTINNHGENLGFKVDFGTTQNYYTDEVLGDDGTYGPSIDYIYWIDSKDVYHQQYITGGMIVHVSSQPIAVKSIILNLESSVTIEPNNK